MTTKLAKTRIALLVMSGALLILVAGSILLSPADFYAANQIELGANVSLINEVKAPAGFLLVAGLFMLGAVVLRSESDTALGLAAMIYVSYAISRLASMALDGSPATGLVQAAALEGVIGLACVLVLSIRQMAANA